MANQKFKLAFLALAFACLMQNAVAAPRPLTGGEKYAPPPEVEIASRAFSEIAKSFSEFLKSVGQIINQALAQGFVKVGLPIYFKAHLMVTASGVQDSALTLTNEQYLEYRVVASTVLQLRQKLEFMDMFEVVFDSILAEAGATFYLAASKVTSSSEILSKLILTTSETLDRRLRLHPELKEAYLHIRAKAQVEEAKVTPILFEFTKQNIDLQRWSQIMTGPIGAKMLSFLVNKQFLHHTFNRFSVLKNEYFTMARSTLELAKKGKLAVVQQVYDKTLREVSSSLDPVKADVFDIAKGLFKQLKINFEADPALNQAWRETQKYVFQRHEWDRGIWDLDLIPI